MTPGGSEAGPWVALDVAPIGAAIIDADGIIRYWNGRAEELLGWSSADVVGKPDPSIPEASRAKTDLALRRLFENPDEARRIVRDRRRRDGTLVTVALLSASRMDTEDGPALLVWFEEATPHDTALQARNRLSRRLVTAQREQEVLPALAEAVEELLGASTAVVLSPCPSRLHLHGVRGLSVHQEVAEEVELDLDSPAPWTTAMAGELAVGKLVLDGDARHTWFIPMGPSDQGWVLAAQYTDGRAPSLLDVEVASGLADEAWIALQRASLVDELDGKIEILEATNALAANVGIDLDQVVRAVTEQAATALSCERAAIYLVDGDGVPKLAHVHASDARPATLVEVAEGLTIAASVLEVEENLLYQDASTCPVADGPWHSDAGAVSLLGLPLRIGARTIGALVVAHTQAHPRGFTSLCQQVGAAVARQAAMAVEHARLYANERDTVEQLRELDRLKADWIAGLTHDLRTPLTGLLGFVQTLQRLSGDVDPADQDQYLEVMARQARRLVRLVEDLLITAQIDGGQVARRRDLVVLPEVVTSLVEMLGPQDRPRVDVRVNRLTATVHGDRGHIERVVQNLVDNAIRHGQGAVTVTVDGDGERVVVRVADDGTGVADDMVDKIFDRFAQGSRHGTSGLGLYVARGIARAHGGDLRLDESYGPGACFELELPAAPADARFDQVASPVRERRQVLPGTSG